MSQMDAYNRVSPTILAALRYYASKQFTVINDAKSSGANDLLKKDLFDHLRSIHYVLSVLTDSSKEHVDRRFENVNKFSEVILAALSVYEQDLEDSKKTTADKLGSPHFAFPSIDKEIDEIKWAREYMQKGYLP